MLIQAWPLLFDLDLECYRLCTGLHIVIVALTGNLDFNLVCTFLELLLDRDLAGRRIDNDLLVSGLLLVDLRVTGILYELDAVRD